MDLVPSGKKFVVAQGDFEFNDYTSDQFTDRKVYKVLRMYAENILAGDCVIIETDTGHFILILVGVNHCAHASLAGGRFDYCDEHGNIYG